MLCLFRMIQRLLFCTLLLANLPAYSAARGTLLQATLVGQYTKDQLNNNFQRLGLQARHGIKLFRVNYQSEIAPGEALPTEASGLVIVPDTVGTEFPWISLQHGTVAGKNEAPSLSPSEGFYEASQGFVVAAMDYLGYGTSEKLFHPYLIAAGYVPVGVDLLRATRTLASQLSIKLGPLFLKGYSEGGYATLALQQALETSYSKEFTVKASAPSAGPYDLELSARVALAQAQANSLYSSFLVLAYDQWLAPEIDLDAIFVIDGKQLQSLYNSGLSSSDILKALPKETRELIDGVFLDDFLADKPQLAQARLIRRLLMEQSLLNDNWVPKSETRFYHCEDDEIVTVQATRKALAHYQSITENAPVSAVIASSPDPSQPYSHATCPLIFKPVDWFSELLAK